MQHRLSPRIFSIYILVPLLVRLCGGFCFCATSKAIKATWKEADLRAPFFIGGSENLAIQSLKQNPAKPIRSHGQNSTFFFFGGFRVCAHWKKTHQGLSEPQNISQAFYDTRLFLRNRVIWGAPLVDEAYSMEMVLHSCVLSADNTYPFLRNWDHFQMV